MSKKNNIILWILLMLAHLSAYSQNPLQSKAIRENEKLIEASQTGAMPLYFDVKDEGTPLISPDSFTDSKEFYIRGGLPNLFEKIGNKKQITLGYLGGSITRGDNMYRNQSAKYIQNMFPAVSFKGINAGVSGTGTELGACRLYDQLLKYKPDVVFIEFAVNGAFKEGMEGIIRQIWKFDPKIDICLLYTISKEQIDVYNSGLIPSNIEGLEKIAEYYNVPSINMGLYPAKLVKQEKLVWKAGSDSLTGKIVFSNDGLHPIEAGGNLYAQSIARAFQVFKHLKSESLPHTIINFPLTKDNWEDAKMFDPKAVALLSRGWKSIEPQSSENLSQFAGWFPQILKADEPGTSFEFTFKGKAFGFFDIGAPEVGELEIEVDGNKVRTLPTAVGRVRQIVFDDKGEELCNRFNVNCNNRYRGQFDMFSVAPGLHHVKIIVSAVKADKRKILGPTQLTNIASHPEKYDQTVFYLGKILVRGEIVLEK